MNIEQYKQTLDMMADEINVKNIELYIGETEMGKVAINYNREVREFNYHLGEEKLLTIPSEKAVEVALKSFFSK